MTLDRPQIDFGMDMDMDMDMDLDMDLDMAEEDDEESWRSVDGSASVARRRARYLVPAEDLKEDDYGSALQMISSEARGTVSDEIQLMRSPTKEGFRAFYEYVCGFSLASHMEDWVGRLVTEKNSACLIGMAGKNIDLLAPRGSAKSTFCVFFNAWAIGIHHGPEYKIPLQVIYVSSSREIAVQKSAEIQALMFTPRYQEVFPWAKIFYKRSSPRVWEIDKAWASIAAPGSTSYTLVTAGMTGMITSRRAALIVMDDIIKSAEAIANPETRRKMENGWLQVIRPTLLPGGRAISLGTLFSKNNIHLTCFADKRYWEQVRVSAIISKPDPITGGAIESSYWPENWRLDILQNIRREDPHAFSYQYQNENPAVEDTPGVPTEWIRRAAPPTGGFDSLAVGGDLAVGKNSTHDWTVFILGGAIGNRIYILDMIRGRWTGNVEKLGHLLGMLSVWGIVDTDEPDGDLMDFARYRSNPMVSCNILVEDNAYQGSIKGDFTEFLHNQAQLYNLNYKGVRSATNTISRLQAVSGLMQGGLVTFNSYADLEVLYSEILNLYTSRHDDCVSAYSTLLSGLYSRKKLQVR